MEESDGLKVGKAAGSDPLRGAASVWEKEDGTLTRVLVLGAGKQ